MGGYVVDFERMLDEVDNPSEVNGAGVGTSASDNPVKREPNAMCRDGVVNNEMLLVALLASFRNSSRS